jgi:hypothetical protein
VVDAYLGTRLGVDFASLRSDTVTLVESPQRLERHVGHNCTRVLWWVWLRDGRSALSVPPGAGDVVSAALEGARSPEALLAPATADALRPVIDDVLRCRGLQCIDGIFRDLCLACGPLYFGGDDMEIAGAWSMSAFRPSRD